MSYISYETFGVNFVRRAVTAERIAPSLADVAGDTVEVGPMPAGPGGLAVVTALGRIGTIAVRPEPGDLLRFAATMPIDLDLEVRIGPVPNRFKGRVEVPLSMTVRISDPLTLVIDVDPVIASDVSVDLRSESAGGDLLQRLGNMEAEVQMQVAQIVNERQATEKATEARVIDVATMIDEAWPTV